MGIGSAVLVAGWLGIATTSMISGNTAADTEMDQRQQELSVLETKLAAARAEAALVKTDLGQRADLLEARQKFLAALLSGEQDAKSLAAMLPRATGNGAADGIATVRALVAGGAAATLKPVAAPFEAIESQQLALVDKATGAAEARLRETRALIKKLGLNPDRFAAASEWRGRRGNGMGGPYIPASADAEPRFKDLFMSWRKLETMQAGLAAIPALVPVKSYRATSGFGTRYDPFNGGLAQHQGLDMAGSHGEPIYAAADGTVNKAGRANGYGNLVELSHGKGIDTRYGHMSKILVKPGQKVKQGDMIGRMGSTGRSTGTHLHYEVRVDGRAINPKPFLAASSYVLAAQSEASHAQPESATTGGTIGPVLPEEEGAEVASSTLLPTSGMMMTPIRPIG